MLALDRKLLRDLVRLWAQALAIALVMAGGVASILIAVGSNRSLEETRIAYYERQRFAHIFAHVERVPNSLMRKISRIPDVAAAEARIVKTALLEIEGMPEPATGRFISVPDGKAPSLNRPYLRRGRMPAPGAADEVVVNEPFAKAHDFLLGSEFHAILNGQKRRLTIVGMALSPEFVYAAGPGDVMPDNRRFGVIWMNERALAAIYGLQGAFSSVSLTTTRGASQEAIIQRLDTLLKAYGGQAAYGRRDQFSHAFLDHGLDMLRSMSRTLPPIFLGVAVFLVNLTLGRMVLLERGQIGLMKALGYRDRTVAFHYMKFVAIVCAAGILIGWGVGNYLGSYVTELYAGYFKFPLLIFAPSPDLYLLAAGLPVVAGVIGAMRSILNVTSLPPAVAMHAAAPPKFRRGSAPALLPEAMLSPLMRMTVRNLLHHRFRAGLTVLGISTSTALLIASLYIGNSMERLIEVKYFRAERQDATVNFVHTQAASAIDDVTRLPGVLAGEGVRTVPVRIRNGMNERRILLYGRAADADLRQIIDTQLRRVAPPTNGLAISEWLARSLDVDIGDAVEIDLLEGRRRTVRLPVTVLVEDYFGMQATIDLGALSRLMREGARINQAELRVDRSRLGALYDSIKTIPAIGGIALQLVSLENFREAIVVIVTAMATIYTGLAAVIAFGVVYNTAQITLSERARELASLRILGFVRAEVYWVLVAELAILVVLSQPVGWALGYAIAWIMKQDLDADLMRMPLAINPETYAISSGVVLGASVCSALLLLQRIYKLDLIAVMKTRE
ncbi:ABC transporter permease [Oricola cellulosilytica]|uniref:FtsX-like permease family protein n=2 Tax=Oricola cellulosilytica TaxID=1429082 RepID=A0A4R0PEU3_9HYPH|nr:ABC transporter permease [Oricola cellulosilytica]TCD16121.1 FtsX-like permease family protein [Oricola cellulosilytica]